MKQIRAFFFVFLAFISWNEDVLSLSQAEKEEVCENHYMETLKDPSDETKYVICVDEPIEGTCALIGDDQSCFDETAHMCSKDACAIASDSQQYREQIKNYCENNKYFFQPLPALDCQHYYICTYDGQTAAATYVACPKNQHYSREKKTCLPSFQAGCESMDNLCLTQGEGYKFPANTDNCYDYYECTRGEPELRSCQYNEQFDEAQLACVKSSKSVDNKCLAKNFRVPNCAAENNGQYFPHQKCNKYYICINGVPLEAYCQSGYYFNESSKTCAKTSELHTCME